MRHKVLIGQLVRFGLTGVLMTLLVAGGYVFVTDFFHIDPNLSMTLVFLVATWLGYYLHSSFSFRDHGDRDPRKAHIRTVRFFIVNVIGFFANQFFVSLLVKNMGGPTWWPTIPIVCVTPLLTFSLQRKWVFG
jgi:putative flippase GtrA